MFGAKHNICITSYLINDAYRISCKRLLKSAEPDGLVDSIVLMFENYNDNAKNLVQQLVNPF